MYKCHFYCASVKGTTFMVCSHCPTPTLTQKKWVCNPFAFVLVSVSVLGSMNTSTQFFITHFLLVSVLVSGSVNTPLVVSEYSGTQKP